MNKRIVLSSVSIFASLALVTGATFAFFSDSETSSANTFGAGTLNLQLDDFDEDFGENGDGVTATFVVDDMAPGDMVAQEISLHNAGTIDIAEIMLGLTSTATPDTTGSDLREVLEMEIWPGGTASTNGENCEGTSDISGTIDNGTIGDGIAPLTMKELDGETYDALAIALAPAPGPGDSDQVCIKVTMDADADDDYQGSSATASFVFTANQSTTQ